MSEQGSGWSGNGHPADASRRVHQQVEDALDLTAYVIASGIKDSDGQPLAFPDIATVEATGVALGMLDASDDGSADSPRPAGSLSKDEWIAFEQAYYRLAMETSPVTAETLRNTRFAAGADGAIKCRFDLEGIIAILCGRSPAQRFTRLLWLITIIFVVIVLLTEWKIDQLGMVADAASVKVKKDVWEAVQPWAYGGLGACAYLLRSAHTLIYQRSFDLRRKPEYFNRILLGAISGGAIILFSDYLLAQSDSVTQIGTTALGFIAGYSSDFLFTTIERIITAIFPRVAVETVPKDKQPKKPARPTPNPPPGGP